MNRIICGWFSCEVPTSRIGNLRASALVHMVVRSRVANGSRLHPARPIIAYEVQSKCTSEPDQYSWQIALLTHAYVCTFNGVRGVMLCV